MRRVPTLLVLTALASIVAAAPAAADPAVPTNYRSEVTAVEPPVDGVTVEVLGGDSFLRVTLEEGHEALVYGYEQEGVRPEYLRFEADGTVLANVNSTAYYVNDDRYGAGQVPARATVDAEPEWERVATGGTYTWHDHRIHWMSPDLPPRVRDASTSGVIEVFDWTVPMEVDGTEVEVRGVLRWLPSEPPILPAVVGVVLLAGAFLAARTGGSRVVGASLLVAGATTTTVAVLEALSAVSTGQGTWIAIGLGTVAVAAAIGSAVLSGRHPAEARRLAFVSGASTLVWSIQRLSALPKPVLPTPLPDVIFRLAVVAAGALALAALASLIAGRQRSSPESG